MPETTSEIAEAVGAAVTGPNTPDKVSVKRPVRPALWSLFVVLGVLCLGVAIVLGLAAYGPWAPNTETIALARIRVLFWLGVILAISIPLIAFAVASPWVGRVEASAGTNSIKLTGRGDA